MKISAVGRVLYALPFLVFGAFHFMNAPMMAAMVPSFIPGGVIWIYLTGAAMIAAAAALILDRMTSYACMGLALMLGVFIVTIHIPGLKNPQMSQMAMISLLKDLALAGAAIYIGGKSCTCKECKDCKEKT